MGKKSRLKKERRYVPWETIIKYRPGQPPEVIGPPPEEVLVEVPEEEWEPDPEAKRLMLLLAALEAGVEAGLFELDPKETMLKAGLDYAKAESARPSLQRFMEEAGAFEGRNKPRKPPPPVLSDETCTKAIFAVRDYIMEHAWCVDTSGSRAYYSPGFKAFILELLGPGGLAAGATMPEAVKVTGVPATTLASWMRQARKKAQAAAASAAAADDQ
jgi:hypothetical protein